jgi:hypothetical protein
MGTISMREFCEAVYCAYVSADGLTVGADGRIAFGASVSDGGRTTIHRVAFEGVSDLSRRCDHPSKSEQGDRMELSVIEVERKPVGWRVWLSLWYVEEVEFHCGGITLDGRAVTGEGRWLQDDLPRRSAV